MNDAATSLGNRSLPRGSNFAVDRTKELSANLHRDLARWYKDPQGWTKISNHDTRSHIVADLHRYLFCAAYGKIGAQCGRLSPKAEEFPEVLAPKHANWKSGDFADRFRVQVANRAATTVTSHISKDGHYFIHYDPKQCRSLTVREAARIQTFPDNYFFLGTRTQQYVQVGNAVPPFLAHQIADIVYKVLSRN
jgi:DNA (cytosine-5)-methyltransferase 1